MPPGWMKRVPGSAKNMELPKGHPDSLSNNFRPCHAGPVPPTSSLPPPPPPAVTLLITRTGGRGVEMAFA